jgi:hypothetical protein
MAGLGKVATDVTINVGACEGKGEGLEVGAGVVMLFIGLGVGAGVGIITGLAVGA